MFTTLSLGWLVGCVLGLTGAGGSIIAVPILVFGLGLSLAEAAPIALLAVTSSAMLGAGLGLKAGLVRYRAAMLMAGFGFLSAPVGVWCVTKIPNRPLTGIFGVVLLFVAWNMLKNSNQADSAEGSCEQLPCLINQDKGQLNWTMPCVRALALTGLLAGFLSGLLGVGGGFVVVPALKKYSNIPVSQILASSLSVIALISMVAIVTTYVTGRLHIGAGLYFIWGSVVGMLMSRMFSKHLPALRLQQVFAVFSMVIAIVMLFRSVC